MSSSKVRKLLECCVPLDDIGNVDSAYLAKQLAITESDAKLLRDPLAIPAVLELTTRLSPESVTLPNWAYSPLLREIHDPPPVLFYRGRIDLLQTPSVAVVGSRRASEYGLRVTRLITRALVESGITVVSGLARGIDAEAHRTTLELGGNTIAVLGTGLDVVYPEVHRALFEAIANGGLIVTEFRRGTPARREHFPIRNRIISGLCSAVVVVEASARSGSLITARLAGEQGRDVLAVPGSIFSPGSEGAHRLIQDGVKLLHSLEDLFEELRVQPRPVQPATRREAAIPLEPAAQLLVSALSWDEARHIDFIASSLDSTPSALAETVLTLEMSGDIKDVGGGRYLRIRA